MDQYTNQAFSGYGFNGPAPQAPQAPVAVPDRAPVQGQLPFGTSPGLATGTQADIAKQYTGAYNNALAMNQSNYNNILAGYQQSIASQTTAQQAISAGYSDLYNRVIDTVKGVGQSRSTAIDATYANDLGQGTQSLIDRGLGNTTVQDSLQRGLSSDRQRNQISNDESIARMTGDYMSQHGLAALSQGERAQADINATTGRQLDFMNSVSARYPDAGLYSSLAAAAGQNAGRGIVPPQSFGGGSFASGAGGGYGTPSPNGGFPGATSGGRLGYVPAGGRYDGTGGGPTSAGTGAGPGGSYLDSVSRPYSPSAPVPEGGGYGYAGYGSGGGSFFSNALSGIGVAAGAGSVAGNVANAGYGSGQGYGGDLGYNPEDYDGYGDY